MLAAWRAECGHPDRAFLARETRLLAAAKGVPPAQTRVRAHEWPDDPEEPEC
jgi:hypothetical protein